MAVTKIDVTICAPPHRDKHVAEIGLWTDKVIKPGTHGCWCPIGEITVDSGQLEFELYPIEDSTLRTVRFQEFFDALQEGKNRLLEIYPELDTE